MVAASRGKELIIFVEGKEAVMDDNYIKNNMTTNNLYDSFAVSNMFDHKYKEDVEKCFNLLDIKEISNQESVIDIPSADGLIDLAPCIGMFQEARFFNGYDIDRQFDLLKFSHPDTAIHWHPEDTLEQKILNLVSVETGQERYCRQVTLPFVSSDKEEALIHRLSTKLSMDEDVQQECTIKIWYGDGQMSLRKYTEEEKDARWDFFEIGGICDVYRPDKIVELKFVQELQHTHFLQCAMYLLAFNIEEGRLWNVRDNNIWSIKIKDRKKFLDQVVTTITKGRVTNYTSDVKFTLQKTHKYIKAQQRKKRA